jgi:hypothetical protein
VVEDDWEATLQDIEYICFPPDDIEPAEFLESYERVMAALQKNSGTDQRVSKRFQEQLDRDLVEKKKKHKKTGKKKRDKAGNKK